MDIPEISILEDCLSYVLFNEGFSTDVKWCVDNRYFLRISPTSTVNQLEKQALLTNGLHVIDPSIF